MGERGSMQALPKKSAVSDGPSLLQSMRGLSAERENYEQTPSDAVRGERFRILVVEDDPCLQIFYAHVLEDTPFAVEMSGDGLEALAKLTTTFYDLVITDLNLPGLDGIALLHWMRLHCPATTAVVISGDGSADRIRAAMREGAKDYLVKPIGLAEFRELIDRCSQSRHHDTSHVLASMTQQLMHDVRGEVLSLEIMIKMVQRGKLGRPDDGINSALFAMQAKLEHLKGLATEYCLLTKKLLEGGEIQTERLRLKEDVIAPVVAEMEDALQRKGVEVAWQWDLAVDDAAAVTGNRVMLQCVFRTLLSNAIKYGKAASVITCGITSDDRRYSIQVANEGDVVPVQMRASIFDEFVQAHTSDPSAQTDGLGLGLALAKDILRQHGGDIWYEAMANGSKFICTLPLGGPGPA